MKITNLLIVSLVALSLNLSAQTIIISDSAPTVDGDDSANTTTAGSRVKWFNDADNIGQSFTTGSNAGGYEISSFSFQLESSGTPTSARNFNFRVIDLSGGDASTSTIISETASTSDAWDNSDWITFNFTTPVALSANTLYGVDAEHSSGGNWSNGIYYVYLDSSSDFTGGSQYSRADGNPTAITSKSGDYIFHADITVVPEPSAFALLAGMFGLTWVMLRRRV